MAKLKLHWTRGTSSLLMISPYAYFDALSICKRLQSIRENAPLGEIYLFSYLSCLLSLYKQRPLSYWSYGFSVTANGYPYSVELDSAIAILLGHGLIDQNVQNVSLTEAGTEEHRLLSELSQNHERDIYIEGACAASLAVPVGTIRRNIASVAPIEGALALSQSRLLLTPSDLEDTCEQFGQLSSIIGVEITDLMIPAIFWLSYLSKVRERDSGE